MGSPEHSCRPKGLTVQKTRMHEKATREEDEAFSCTCVQRAYVLCLRPKLLQSYNRRDAALKLSLRKTTADYLKRSLSYGGAFLWNNLPEEEQQIPWASSKEVFVK